MDNDRIDRDAPANRPHQFESLGVHDTGVHTGPCGLCKRGSAHHVHDASPLWEKHAPEGDYYEPEGELADVRTAPEPTRIEPNTPHAYAPEFDPSGRCKVCGHMPKHIVHGFKDNAPEPSTPHVFIPGGVTVEGIGEYCKVCGFLANAFDHAHIAPDPVNQPAHYTAHPSGIECIQITEHMSFNLGNAVKYIWRADLKGDAVTDLEKARWYIEREITRRTRE